MKARSIESLLRSLDGLAPRRGLEGEINYRVEYGSPPGEIDVEIGARSVTRRLAALAVALAVFLAGAGLTWIAFRPRAEVDPNRPASSNASSPDIVPIDDGYLLDSGQSSGIAWQLVAIPATEVAPPFKARVCGDGRFVVVYRDGESTEYQSCPSPHFSAELFLTDQGNGAQEALIVGTTSMSVASIQMETTDDRSVGGVILPMGSVLDAGFNAFVIEVPAPFEGKIVAKDSVGSALQEREVMVPEVAILP